MLLKTLNFIMSWCMTDIHRSLIEQIYYKSKHHAFITMIKRFNFIETAKKLLSKNINYDNLVTSNDFTLFLQDLLDTTNILHNQLTSDKKIIYIQCMIILLSEHIGISSEDISRRLNNMTTNDKNNYTKWQQRLDRLCNYQSENGIDAAALALLNHDLDKLIIALDHINHL